MVETEIFKKNALTIKLTCNDYEKSIHNNNTWIIEKNASVIHNKNTSDEEKMLINEKKCIEKKRERHGNRDKQYHQNFYEV